jgi:Meckel syndrome type 1 protein
MTGPKRARSARAEFVWPPPPEELDALAPLHEASAKSRDAASRERASGERASSDRTSSDMTPRGPTEEELAALDSILRAPLDPSPDAPQGPTPDALDALDRLLREESAPVAAPALETSETPKALEKAPRRVALSADKLFEADLALEAAAGTAPTIVSTPSSTRPGPDRGTRIAHTSPMRVSAPAPAASNAGAAPPRADTTRAADADTVPIVGAPFQPAPAVSSALPSPTPTADELFEEDLALEAVSAEGLRRRVLAGVVPVPVSSSRPTRASGPFSAHPGLSRRAMAMWAAAYAAAIIIGVAVGRQHVALTSQVTEHASEARAERIAASRARAVPSGVDRPGTGATSGHAAGANQPFANRAAANGTPGVNAPATKAVGSPVSPGQAGPGRAGPGRAGPGQAGPVQAGPGQAGPGQVGPDQVGPDQVSQGQAAAHQGPTTDPAVTRQAGSNQVAANQAGPNQGSAGRTSGNQPRDGRPATASQPPVPVTNAARAGAPSTSAPRTPAPSARAGAVLPSSAPAAVATGSAERSPSPVPISPGTPAEETTTAAASPATPTPVESSPEAVASVPAPAAPSPLSASPVPSSFPTRLAGSPAAASTSASTPSAGDTEALRAASRATDAATLRGLLTKYESVYERLDARGASAIWPSVDQAALDRAFGGLRSQELRLDRCRLSVATLTATASCQGSLRIVRRVGSADPLERSLEWTFRFERRGEDWQIASVRTTR